MADYRSMRSVPVLLVEMNPIFRAINKGIKNNLILHITNLERV